MLYRALYRVRGEEGEGVMDYEGLGLLMDHKLICADALFKKNSSFDL